MVQDASLHGIPAHGAYAVRAPHAADGLGAPLRGAFGKQPPLPADIEACLAQLRQIRARA